jgi:hypothetical protein
MPERVAPLTLSDIRRMPALQTLHSPGKAPLDEDCGSGADLAVLCRGILIGGQAAAKPATYE